MARLPASTQLEIQETQRVGGAPAPLGQAVPALATGLKVGEAVEERDLERQFGQLLDAGLDGMIAMKDKLEEDGTITPGEVMDPRLPVYQKDEQGQISWYKGLQQVIKGKEQARLKAETQERRVQAALPGATLEEKVRSGVEREVSEKELETTVTGVDEAQLQTALEEHLESLNLPEEVSEDELQELALEFFQTDPRFAEEESVKTLLGLLEGQLKRESAERAASQRAKGTQARGERIDFRTFIKGVNAASPVVTAINKVDLAIPGGIDDPTGKGLGVVGFGTKNFRKWINSGKGIKLRQAVNNFFLAKLKKQSGVAVSDEEFVRVENSFGLDTRSTVQAFIESMVIARDDSLQELINLEALLSPEQLKDARARGVTTSKSLTPKRKKPKSPTKKSSDNEIKAFLRSKGKNDSDANVEKIKKRLGK